MTDWQKPSVGRIVHYVSHGTPKLPDGSQAFTSECRAAVITAVKSDTEVDLFVMNPTGVFLNSGCLFVGEDGPGYDSGADKPGDPACPNPEIHGNPMRYCTCGWIEGTGKASYPGGTWHWPERV